MVKKLSSLALTRHIPNLLTCLNLFTGCIGITLAFKGMLPQASWCIGIAVLFDYADGFAARTLKAYTRIGKEMDSFADMVSFGVLPGMIFFLMAGDTAFMPGSDQQPFWHFTAFLIPVFSALRLARFNLAEGGDSNFSGLPTPANALFAGSLPLIEQQNYPWISDLLNTPEALIITAVILSFLLISPFSLFSLKFKTYNFSANKIRYLFLTTALILLTILGYGSIPVIIVWYIVLSLITQSKRNNELSSRD